jgi:DNA mismatch endonuclease (patch repair protein)
MIDRISKKQRSANMSAVKNKNTSPELEVRSKVFAQGFRFRLHTKKLPGSPDLVFHRYKVAVFVHGCFWHGHNCKKGKRPVSNQGFWDQKIDINIARDKAAESALTAQKWKVVTIWGCDLDAGTAFLIGILKKKRAVKNKSGVKQRA